MDKFEQIGLDDEETIRNRSGFVPVSQYASVRPMSGEIGSVRDVRFPLADPVIIARREVIRASRFGKKRAEPAMRAECVLMGHVRLAPDALCLYCGAEE